MIGREKLTPNWTSMSLLCSRVALDIEPIRDKCIDIGVVLLSRNDSREFKNARNELSITEV